MASAPGNGTRADGSYGAVAAALVDAVRPLGERGVPVELSLTGGKDSRLIAAALTAAQVPFRARTHGFANATVGVVRAFEKRRVGLDEGLGEAHCGRRALETQLTLDLSEPSRERQAELSRVAVGQDS